MTPSLHIAREALSKGDHATAIAQYQGLLAQSPADTVLYLELSSCFAGAQQLDEALVVARQARLYADDAFRARCDHQIAAIYMAQKRYDAAGALFHQIMLSVPEAATGLAGLYLKTGLPGKACAVLESIPQELRDLRWITNMSLALFQMRQADDAIKLILDYMREYGVQRELLSNALMSSHYTAEHDSYQKQLRELVEQAYAPRSSTLATPSTNSTLKVGFVSADFNWHPVGYFLHSFLPHLREFGVETYLYSNNPTNDSLTQTLQAAATRFSSIHGMNTQNATEHIRTDGLHMLIDLSGHTSGNRLDVFHERAAPLQASYLGYTGSTYLPGMDYLLTDEAHVHANEHGDYSEKIAYLPATRFCYRLPMDAPAIAPAPIISNGYLTLGSFANPAKISPQCAKTWGEILLALPTSRLKLRHAQWDDDMMRLAMLQEWVAMGIAPGRIEFYGQAKYDRYLASFSEIDIMLDSFPFSGATTTCEALWMGVPSLTLPGSVAASRQGVSILSSVDEQGWMVQDTQEAIGLLTDVQNNPQALTDFRARIRQKIAASPLGDGGSFARNFSACLQRIMGKN